jgi:putative transposase
VDIKQRAATAGQWGLQGVRLIISDACGGLVDAAAEVFSQTDWQRCVVHWYRNVFSHVPNGKVAEVARMLKAIHAQEDRKAARAKAAEIVTRLREMKLRNLIGRTCSMTGNGSSRPPR